MWGCAALLIVFYFSKLRGAGCLVLLPCVFLCSAPGKSGNVAGGVICPPVAGSGRAVKEKLSAAVQCPPVLSLIRAAGHGSALRFGVWVLPNTN